MKNLLVCGQIEYHSSLKLAKEGRPAGAERAARAALSAG